MCVEIVCSNVCGESFSVCVCWIWKDKRAWPRIVLFILIMETACNLRQHRPGKRSKGMVQGENIFQTLQRANRGHGLEEQGFRYLSFVERVSQMVV